MVDQDKPKKERKNTKKKYVTFGRRPHTGFDFLTMSPTISVIPQL